MKRKLFCLLSFLGLMLVGCGSAIEEEPIDSNPNTSVSDDNTNQDPTTDPDPSSEVEHTHSYEEGVYMSDENGHWQVCVDNDGTTDVVSHDYDNGVYVNVENEENHVVYCSVCNYQLVQAHEFSGSYMDNDDSLNHYYLCVKCDYKLLEQHAYGNYTSGTTPGTHSAECSCGMVDIKECSYDLSKYQYSDSTGHYRICDLCSSMLFESHNLVDCECACSYSQEHSYNGYSFDSSGHRQECTSCGNKTATSYHYGLTTNIDNPNYHVYVCTVCSYEYPDLESHRFGDQAMYYDENTHTLSCSYCGYTIYEEHTSTNSCDKCIAG